MSRLITLPAKLRLMIWEDVVPRDNVIVLSPHRQHASDREDARVFFRFIALRSQNGTRLQQSLKNTIALITQNRQTSIEVKAMLFANNCFRFDETCTYGFSFDLRRLRWTLPREFGLYVKHVQLEIHRSCFFSKTVYGVARNVLELLATALTAGEVKATPLQALDIVFVRLRYFIPHGYWHAHEGLDAAPHLLEPLVALASRKVQEMSCSFMNQAGPAYPELTFETLGVEGLETFTAKLRRVLLESIEMRENDVDLMDEAEYGYDIFVPSYDWNDPRFES